MDTLTTHFNDSTIETEYMLVEIKYKRRPILIKNVFS